MMFNLHLIWLWITYDWKYKYWYGPITFIKDIPLKIKWFWQRKTRGWDDTDIWTLDVTIAKFIEPRLRHLRDNHYGYPCDVEEVEWNLILDKMIEAFELAQIEECSVDGWQKRQEKIDEGLSLFAKYFQGLWD